MSGSPVVWDRVLPARGSGELNFYFDRNDRELTTLVMLHETNHYLTYLIDPEFRYPIWINESLAEYYGASKWNPATKTMTVGGLQEGRIAAIQDQILAGKWQGLDALMRTPQASFTADCYAWGWSFVHFLLENKRYAQKFKTFYVSLARDKAVKTTKIAIGPTALRTVEPDEVIRVLLQHLGVKDLDTLEKEWHESVKALQPTSARGYAEAARPLRGARHAHQGQAVLPDRDRQGRPAAGRLPRARRRARAEERTRAPPRRRSSSAIEGDPLNGPYYVALSRAIAQRTRQSERRRVGASPSPRGRGRSRQLGAHPDALDRGCAAGRVRGANVSVTRGRAEPCTRVGRDEGETQDRRAPNAIRLVLSALAQVATLQAVGRTNREP